MSYIDHAKVSPPKRRFVSHKQGRYARTGEGFLIHETGDKIDLHALLTNHSISVELMPVDTNIMRASGLHHGSIAVVDRAGTPERGKIVAVRYNGITVLRKLDKRNGRWCLVPDDPREEILYCTEETQVERIGVVKFAIIYLP